MKDGMASAAEPSFLCTFCWTAKFRPAKPKVLGREARIACETCWSCVLDLSICWVCGEIVVRGEEVVSLGWCFWHRGCFGCLICGISLDPSLEDKEEKEIISWIDDDGSKKKLETDYGYPGRLGRGRDRRQRGVELDTIPLCSWCKNTTGGLDKHEVLKIGLNNVTKKDGGLARSRLDMLNETKPKDTIDTSTTGQIQGHNNEYEHERRANILLGVAETEIGEYRNPDRTSNCNNPAESTPAMIYISVLNATDEPFFRPSKTKPLPRWMTLLPSNRQQTLEQNGTKILSSKTRTPVYSLTSVVHNEPHNSCPAVDTTTTSSGLTSLGAMNQVISTGPDPSIGPDMEHKATSKPVISRDNQVEISNCHTPTGYRAHYPQQNPAPYSFKRAVYRSRLSPSIPRSSFTRPVTATTMPAILMPVDGGSFSALTSQIANPLLSKNETLKKRDVSREAEPIVERFKRQKTEGAALAGREKIGCRKEVQEATQVEYVNRRDELRRELMAKFNGGRRDPSQE